MSATAWRQGDSGLSVFDRDQLERNGWRADHVEPSGPTSTSRFPARASAKMIAALALSALLFPILASIASAAEFSGYVKPTALNVREDAGAKSAIAGILLKYDPVTVTGEVNIGRTRWYSIKTSGGYVTSKDRFLCEEIPLA